jgi:Protein of Unknown function (DUF2604)
MMASDKQLLTIIVNGVPASVERNEHAPLLSAIEAALQQTGNVGQPPENWELRDASGNLLDVHQKIADFHFPADVKLFLSLRAGVGG